MAAVLAQQEPGGMTFRSKRLDQQTEARERGVARERACSERRTVARNRCRGVARTPQKARPSILERAGLRTNRDPFGTGETRLGQTDTPSSVGSLAPEKAARVRSASPVCSPDAGRSFPTEPLFGDTHLRTAFSFDTGAFGARVTPAEAYRFARASR
jgi:hypothetical protein